MSLTLFSRETLLREQLVEQVVNERLANVQVQRPRLPLSTAQVDYDAVGKTVYLTQCPPQLLAAIRRLENGRQGLELGYYGKTEFGAEFFDGRDRQYGEAGRKATKELWRWVQADPQRWHEYTEHLGQSYYAGGGEGNKSWSKQVRALAKQERARLSLGQEGTATK